MQLTSLLRSAAIIAVLSVLSLLLFQTAQAQTETDLYNFCSVGGAAIALTASIPSALSPRMLTGISMPLAVWREQWLRNSLRTLPRARRRVRNGTNTGNGWCEFVLYNFCSVANCARRKRASGQCVLPQRALQTHRETFTARPTWAGATMSGIVFEISSKPPLNPVAQRAATRAAAGARRCSITSAPHSAASARMVIIRSGISSRTRPVISMARLRTACSSCLPTNRADGIAS